MSEQVENHARKRAEVHGTNNGGRKCTKLVLKLLAAKNDLSISVPCTALFL